MSIGTSDPMPFWNLESPSSTREQANWDDGMDWERIVCPVNPGHQRAGKRITDLHIVVPSHGISDFIRTPVLSYCVIRDQVMRLFRKEGITGFVVKPVKVQCSRTDEAPPILWELVVTGWAGMAKPASGVRLDESASCRECGHLRYKGLCNPKELIDGSQWDGSDFFMVWPLPKYIFVTNRVVTIIRDHRLTGFHPAPVSELRKTDGFTPGRLHYYMPEDRARQLGEPLGIY